MQQSPLNYYKDLWKTKLIKLGENTKKKDNKWRYENIH